MASQPVYFTLTHLGEEAILHDGGIVGEPGRDLLKLVVIE